MHDKATEARLRAEMLAGRILPANMGERDRFDRTGLHRMTQAGWILGRQHEEAPIFVTVTTPPPFLIRSIQPTVPGRTPWWAEAMDRHMRQRALLFYYPGSTGIGGSPPSAHVALLPRFTVTRLYGQDGYTTGFGVHDAGQLVHRVGDHPDIVRSQFATSGDLFAAAETRKEVSAGDYREAVAWLKERAPISDDVLAYWGAEDQDILTRG